uniref:Uncharacterized protein n=1 Tax=viral metagenome TaxID=1070528 RepID=A0A6C0E5Z7_9ZZZZ
MRKTRGQAKKEKRRRTVRKQRGGDLKNYVTGRFYDSSKTLAEIAGNPILDEEEKKKGYALLNLSISTELFDGAMTPQQFSSVMAAKEKEIEDNATDHKEQYQQLLEAENEYRGDEPLKLLSQTAPLYLWYWLIPLQDKVEQGGQVLALASLPVPPVIAAAMKQLAPTEPVAPVAPAP